MHPFNHALVVASLILTLCFSATVPQVTLEIGLTNEPSYGYQGCGFYRFINYGTGYALSTNGSDPAAGVVSMPVTEGDDAQRWLMALVSSSPQWMIINAGTGAVLSAVKKSQPARAALGPPSDLRNRWKFVWDRQWADQNAQADIIENVGINNNVLDLTKTRREAGVPILTYPRYNPPVKNQGWFLEFLGVPGE